MSASPLVLGPVLRHVGDATALIWVQLDRAATVTVLGCSARTFEVRGHHYALVTVTGLEPDTTYPYEVAVDGAVVWPPAVTPFPPSSLRTRGPGRRQRIVFGSCRYAKVTPFTEPKLARQLGIDALDALAVEMTRQAPEQWPDALLLLGDQVYADELTPQNRRRIAGNRDRHPDWPDNEIVDYVEYVGLYRDSWSDPEVRWLLSCVPTAMIFDDHDVRDDWNTSAAWRRQIAQQHWWRPRIRSALASYWVYQHLGNLSPAQLAADPDFRAVTAAKGDTWPLLGALADRADARADGLRFSFRWDLGTTRFVMIDSRNGRVLDGDTRLMVGEEELDWVEEQVTARDGAAVEHVVLGTSVPWLLPHAIGDVQSIVSVLAARPGRRGRLGERLRQAADLEHWQAFRASFDRLARLVTDVATGPDAPATVSVLSGDVHHSYAARVDLPVPGGGRSAVHQLTCSPVHNAVDWFIRPTFGLGWSTRLARVTAWGAQRAGVAPTGVTWRKLVGPLHGNTVATLELDGRDASVTFAQPRTAGSLVQVARLDLTGDRHPGGTPAAAPDAAADRHAGARA